MNKKKCKICYKTYKKICIYQKKAVPLHRNSKAVRFTTLT